MSSEEFNEVSRPGEKRWPIVVGVILVVTGVAMAIVMVRTSADRALTPLEASLFQLLALGLSISGSFIAGRQSALRAAKDIIRPHARSAFRRVWSLYESLSRLAQQIQLFQDNEPPLEAERMLDVLAAMVTEQLATGGDAIEDWRDIVPEDVAALERAARARESGSLEVE